MQEDVIADPEITLVEDSLVSTQASTYQWLIDGEPLTGANGQSILPVESGGYQVKVTYFNACYYFSEPFYVTVEPGTFSVTFSITDIAGNEIPDAVITLNTTTNDAGDYIFPDIEPGFYDYLVKRDGYLDHEGQISVVDNDKDVEVVMIFDETGLAKLPPGLLVYPNPARGKITIESDILIRSVLLINMQGQVVLREMPNSRHFTLFPGQRQRGLYLLHLNTGYDVISKRIELLD